MDALTRFLKYISIDTESDDKNDESHPSSPEQWELAKVLVEELKGLGIEDAHTSEFCVVYAHIPATPGYEDKPAFGFIAHIDTVLNGKGVSPRIIENYDGADVILENGVVIKVSENPELPSLAGRKLVVTDGSTILGADDKAGVAVIMQMCENIMNSGIPHGKICVSFTPDEEIGTGVDKFDLDEFGADFAVTVDGGAEDTIECENFNAASAKVTATGVMAHPGSAKDIMINAAALITEFHQSLPRYDVPEHTDGYQGFCLLEEIHGGIEHATAEYIIRDFSRESLDARKAYMTRAAQIINNRYGKEVICAETKDSYSNMADVLKQHPDFLKTLETAITNAGMEPKYLPIRGGTDGCRLSYMGLPCPNLGAGGYGFHGVHEHCTAEGLDNAVQVLMELVKLYAE